MSTLADCLPCPFCGGAASYDEGRYRVSCDSPECAGALVPRSKQQAVELWNSRLRSTTVSDYTAWLIEINKPSGPVYFQISHDDDWTKDHDQAAHFSRRQDARRAIEYYGWTEAQAVEHCWPAPRLTERSLKVSVSGIGEVPALDAVRRALSPSVGGSG